MRRAFVLAVLLLAGPATSWSAEPAVGELQLASIRDVPGTVGIVDGTTGPQGSRFNVPGLSFFQPTSVTLVAGREGDDLRIRFGKFGWDEDFMGGSTGDAAYRIDRFRTQGDLLITVSAPSPGTPYRLIVWSGEETPPSLQPVVVPASDAGSRWGLPAKIAAAVVAAALLLGGAFHLGRKRSRA